MRNMVMLLALIAVCAVALVGYLAMNPRTETAMVTSHQYQRVFANTTQPVGSSDGSVGEASDGSAPTTSLKSDTHQIGPAEPVQVDTIDANAVSSSGPVVESNLLAANVDTSKKSSEPQAAPKEKTTVPSEKTPAPVNETAPAKQSAATKKAIEEVNDVNKNTFLPNNPALKAKPPVTTHATPTTPAAASRSSFDENGLYVLGKEMQKNGFHQGEPTIVVVDKGSHFTYVLQKQAGDRVVIVDRLSNAIGKDKTPSPPGPYKISVIQKMPIWTPTKSIDPKQKPVQPYNKDHKNPLGVACITLNKFDVALHGTNDPNSIRKDQSHGCIRHSNADIIKIVNKVKRNTVVVITNQFVGTKITKGMFGKEPSKKNSAKKKVSAKTGTHTASKHISKKHTSRRLLSRRHSAYK